jgi:hypothetical protein
MLLLRLFATVTCTRLQIKILRVPLLKFLVSTRFAIRIFYMLIFRVIVSRIVGYRMEAVSMSHTEPNVISHEHITVDKPCDQSETIFEAYDHDQTYRFT